MTLDSGTRETFLRLHKKRSKEADARETEYLLTNGRGAGSSWESREAANRLKWFVCLAYGLARRPHPLECALQPAGDCLG